jgi:hypothetical protein
MLEKALVVSAGAPSRLTDTTSKSLDCQAFAALGTASVDDSAATACFHAHQEAVGACAANFGGLIRAFHGATFSV